MTAAPPTRCQPDIVERLRVWPAAYGEDAFNSTYVGLIMKQAAEIIEQYRADQQHDEQLIDELRTAPARCDAESVEAAARIIHPGAFDQEAGSEHQRHEAKTKAERVLALVSPPSEAGREIPSYEFPYQQTFEAIAAATSLYPSKEPVVGISISVRKFQEAFNSHRDRRALSPDQGTVAVASGGGDVG